jgi:hypothetical protein
VTRYDGSPFILDGRQMLASNARLHEEMTSIIAGVAGSAAGGR